VIVEPFVKLGSLDYYYLLGLFIFIRDILLDLDLFQVQILFCRDFLKKIGLFLIKKMTFLLSFMWLSDFHAKFLIELTNSSND